ncbi:hypothetical protein KM043_011688 [Ampulex compressa]|nr:hypothetical protein KM043_011688 [Ampulex compressa]
MCEENNRGKVLEVHQWRSLYSQRNTADNVHFAPNFEDRSDAERHFENSTSRHSVASFFEQCSLSLGFTLESRLPLRLNDSSERGTQRPEINNDTHSAITQEGITGDSSN